MKDLAIALVLISKPDSNAGNFEYLRVLATDLEPTSQYVEKTPSIGPSLLFGFFMGKLKSSGSNSRSAFYTESEVCTPMRTVTNICKYTCARKYTGRFAKLCGYACRRQTSRR